MSAIDDLISQIADTQLRNRIREELDKIGKRQRFGLVFENHLPECTFLYEYKVAPGRLVACKSGSANVLYQVVKIVGDNAVCLRRYTNERANFPLKDLVVAAEFGDPIYPYLKPLDSICNAPDSDLWHILIESDNYHALQLLDYLYHGKVDCIYIDPPYNTGARDWKYNNDYVDSSDVYRHSKWLSMMERRLKLAKRLLKQDTGVLIVTIDEHEVHHLRTLLEQLMPEFYIQMVTDVVNPAGVTQGRFSRVEEYVIYCFAKNAFVNKSSDNLLNSVDVKKNKPRWRKLLRSGDGSARADRANMFYPILIDPDTKRVIRAADPLPLDQDPVPGEKIDGLDAAWPIRKNDTSFGRWSVGAPTLNSLIEKGYVGSGRYDPERKTYGVKYLSEQIQNLIASGDIIIKGRDDRTGVVDVEYALDDTNVIKTVWHRQTHNNGNYGTNMISQLTGSARSFSYPKSLYSTKDAIAAIVLQNRQALIVDFFAGSGTTLHAVNLMNAEDKGERKCILVTNNEVAEKDMKDLVRDGVGPGTSTWDEAGICRAITWPRIVNSIKGRLPDGTALNRDYITRQTAENKISRKFTQIPWFSDSHAISTAFKKQFVGLLGKEKLPQSSVTGECDFIADPKYQATILFNTSKKDDYLQLLEDIEGLSDFYIFTSDTREFNKIKAEIEANIDAPTSQELVRLPMSSGFHANVAFFQLGFLDRTAISLGEEFSNLIPLLWLKAGGKGACPVVNPEDADKNFYIFSQNRFAILPDERNFNAFRATLASHPEVSLAYLITDSESAFQAMSAQLGTIETIQLYRDYLDNFSINRGGRR